jgi:hypothetical protein
MLPARTRRLQLEGSHPVTMGLDALESMVHDDTHVLVNAAEGEILATVVGESLEGQLPPAIVARAYGAGRVVYLPGRLDALQCHQLTPTIERLFANAVRWVIRGDLIVDVHAPAPIGVTLFDQPDRRILHLVNFNGDTRYKSDTIEPIENVHVQLEMPAGARVRRLHRLWDKTDVPFEATGDDIRFTLGRMGEYEVAAAELETP